MARKFVVSPESDLDRVPFHTHFSRHIYAPGEGARVYSKAVKRIRRHTGMQPFHFLFPGGTRYLLRISHTNLRFSTRLELEGFHREGEGLVVDGKILGWQELRAVAAEYIQSSTVDSVLSL